MLTLPGDNNAWTLAVVPMAGDTPFKALRHNDVWTRVVACVPHAAHWLDGEPITDVIAMAGVLDRLCRIVVDGRPVVTGLVPVGDAWACTNPTAGRGISLGLAHAVALRDTVREKAGDPVGLVARFDEVTEATITPWFRDQYDRDRQRAADTQARARWPTDATARSRSGEADRVTRRRRCRPRGRPRLVGHAHVPRPAGGGHAARWDAGTGRGLRGEDPRSDAGSDAPGPPRGSRRQLTARRPASTASPHRCPTCKDTAG